MLSYVTSTEAQAASTEILTPSELAERLKLPVSWIYEHTRSTCSNPIPVLRCGRYLRFDWADIIGWLRRQPKQALLN